MGRSWKTCYGLEEHMRDFPGGAVVKNPPANAGDTGSSPGPEDPTCRGATKPVRHNYRAHALARTPQLEKPAHCNKQPACQKERYRMPQRRSRLPQLRPDTAKLINKY